MLVFAQLWSVVHQPACLVHDVQRNTNMDGLLKDVSALITGLPGLALVLVMLRNIY
jgi:DMSO/TMAO reductase YedYZ heme-binding membrane subunit